ncbi:MAG: ribosome-binding factor A [Flavobacterium sp.]|jgi:ribosome-binding factor A
MPREFSRGRRVADLIQRELAILLQREVKDPRIGMITVNEVTVSRDLAYADVYFTVLPDEHHKESVEILNSAAGFLRSQLAKILATRTTPKLRFHYDKTIVNGARMSKAIDDALKRDQQNHIDDE